MRTRNDRFGIGFAFGLIVGAVVGSAAAVLTAPDEEPADGRPVAGEEAHHLQHRLRELKRLYVGDRA